MKEQEKDQLVICEHCGSKLCYEQHLGGYVVTWMCLKCGYTTSTVFTEGHEVYKKTIETLPELYKKLAYTGITKRVWMPATVVVPEVGMVFIDGDSVENWEWAGVRATPLTTEEMSSGKFPKDQQFKMDMKGVQKFGKEGFLEAFEYAGFLTEEMFG